MAEFWKAYWNTILPVAFLAVSILCALVDGDRAVRVKKFPKIRTWLLFGAATALFLLWFNVGMYFWEMGLRPVLLILFLVFGALFVLHALRARKCAGGRTLTWLTYLSINLIPGWYIGTTVAGVFQTLYWKGPEGVSQALVKLVSQVIFWGVVLLVVWGFTQGGDDRAVPETDTKGALRSDLEAIEQRKRQQWKTRRDELIVLRRNLVNQRRDTSAVDAEIRDLNNKLGH